MKQEELERLASDSHTKWLMFLNADPGETGCADAPSKVYMEAFLAGAQAVMKRAKAMEEALESLHKIAPTAEAYLNNPTAVMSCQAFSILHDSKQALKTWRGE